MKKQTNKTNNLFNVSEQTEQKNSVPFLKKYPRDPGSAITHFIGVLMAFLAAFPLLIKAALLHSPVYFISLAIFACSMVGLYSASTIYHTFGLSEKIHLRLKRVDHMMIYVLIAGTYTPICLIALGGKIGLGLFALVWGIALVGVIQCIFFINCPKWVSAAIYIAMGWCCVLAFTQIIDALSATAFGWLLAGGIIYTIGGVIYALKLPILDRIHKNFGSHEVFHLFCLGGSLCHFVVMFFLL